MKREFLTSLFSADNTIATTVTVLAYHTPALKQNLYTAQAMMLEYYVLCYSDIQQSGLL